MSPEGTGPRAGFFVWLVVCVLDFVQERSHNMSPSGFESMFDKDGDRETMEGLRVEEAIGEQLQLPKNLTGKK